MSAEVVAEALQMTLKEVLREVLALRGLAAPAGWTRGPDALWECSVGGRDRYGDPVAVALVWSPKPGAAEVPWHVCARLEGDEDIEGTSPTMLGAMAAAALAWERR